MPDKTPSVKIRNSIITAPKKDNTRHAIAKNLNILKNIIA